MFIVDLICILICITGASSTPAWFWIVTPSLIQKWRETSYLPSFGGLATRLQFSSNTFTAKNHGSNWWLFLDKVGVCVKHGRLVTAPLSIDIYNKVSRHTCKHTEISILFCWRLSHFLLQSLVHTISLLFTLHPCLGTPPVCRNWPFFTPVWFQRLQGRNSFKFGEALTFWKCTNRWLGMCLWRHSRM